MPLRYTQRILDTLSHEQYQPPDAETLSRHLKVEAEDAEAFSEAMRRLLDDGRVVRDAKGILRLPVMPSEVTGRIRITARGFAFVIPDAPYREGDLFVPAGGTLDAVSGDTVRAIVRRQSSRERSRPGQSDCVGRVVEVIERKRSTFAGTLVQRGGTWLVEPDGRLLREPVVVRDPHAKDAKRGDKVVVDMIRFPEGGMLGEAVITKVLGEAGRPDVETQAVIEAHGLRTEFPDEVADEAMSAARRFDEECEEGVPADREDLTARFIFTIDPSDSKDFDDAISLRHNAKDGTFELGVHIADVAHFVRPGSAMDREAQARGNSVYLPRLVLPMLPEVLSNGVCSLQEGVPRFAKSVFIRLGPEGEVLGQRLSSTLIRSAKRLTYLEAQAVIDGDLDAARKHARTDTEHTPELVETLRLADRLAKIIRARRQGQGMIALALPAVELIFDDRGHVIDARPEDDAFTHTIIEMFMVEANEALARTFSSLHVPVLRRIHPEPTFGDIEELRQFALLAKYRLPEEPTRRDIQRLLDHTRHTPAARAIHFAVLRTLTRASYSPALIGHFALASEHYAHFTSPIRRYPDLTLHRAVEAYLERTRNGREMPRGEGRSRLGRGLRKDARIPTEEALVALGHHCSDMERNAEDAEQSLRTFLVLQHLAEKHLGEEFPGLVTGVGGGGVFVSIERYLVDGLVPPAHLPQSQGREDRWSVDRTTARLTAGRSGMSVGVGDMVRVRIVEVDTAARHLTLELTGVAQRADRGESEGGAPRRRGDATAPRKSKSAPTKGGRSAAPRKKKRR